jgi:hypothetical protein
VLQPAVSHYFRNGPGNDAMHAEINAETLDAEYYRERAHLCHKLAEAAHAARPLFARLYFLAKEYEDKARVADFRSANRRGAL